MKLFAHIFASRTSSAARALAREGARQRKLSDQQRKIAMLNQLRAELGMQPYETAR